MDDTLLDLVAELQDLHGAVVESLSRSATCATC
jgi:hypothetical protein